MHPQELREEVRVVAAEVREELRVFVESQELTDDLDGEDFRVAQRGGGSATSLMRPRPSRRSSMRQKTATMKVLRSTARDLLRFGRIGRRRA
jgi:hypothetical protein